VLVLLFISLLGNVLLGILLFRDVSGSLDTDTPNLHEKFLLGDKDATDKVAVIRIEGTIYEAAAKYPIRQMEKAAKDQHVKAVVLRIDSPGGTVSASEELYQSVVNLRDNTGRRFPGSGPKPVTVSMGALAASGGYYVASAGKPIAAERTTITGSIGVFAALPNVAKLANDNGVKVELVKAGDIKASGSFFHDMTPEERQTWQDTVDHAYDLFLERVAAGRPLKKDQLRNELVINETIQVRDDKGNPKLEKGKPETTRYTRKRADGGTFTADQALKFGLIDKVEDLPASIRAAASTAGLTKFRAVVYDKPERLLELLTGNQIRVRQDVPDFRSLSAALTPRLWYLAPTADGAILTPNP
jgi:protease-4